MDNSAVQLLRRFTLALCVWREARGETPKGKRLVAQVVENRVQDARWPDTYVGVITQPWQFSAFNKTDPNALKFPSESDPMWPACVTAADAVLTSAVPFTTANHYHAATVSPAWKDNSRVVAREMNHIFYEL